LAFDANTVAVSSDGHYLLAGFEDQNARLWDMSSGTEITDYGGSWGTIAMPSAVFSPDGRWVLTSSTLNAAWLCDAKTSNLVHSLDGHSSAITSMAFLRMDSSSRRQVPITRCVSGKLPPANG
jgi:WD40 repeat protein